MEAGSDSLVFSAVCGSKNVAEDEEKAVDIISGTEIKIGDLSYAIVNSCNWQPY